MSVLRGYVVLELAGLGAAPMAGMLLADMGAEVIRIDRPGGARLSLASDPSLRGKQSVVLNLKCAADVESLLRLVEKADVLIDPYRPGVCEKLGVGPEVCAARNRRLIFARMTGWGQTGPLAAAAGHDINYIAVTGALHAIGRQEHPPVPPLNLVGDMGGGGMLLVNGILAALLESKTSGLGQIVDTAMVDGAAQLMWMFHGLRQSGQWNETSRAANALDGGAYFYGVYECADSRYIALGSIEPAFHDLMIKLMGLDPKLFSAQYEESRWAELKQVVAAAVKRKSRDEWCAIFEGSDACFAPVLTMSEAVDYPPNVARACYVEVDGVKQPAPAPRFSRTPSQIAHGAHALGADTASVLARYGIGRADQG